jgi:peptide/nickel transport system permease protein
MRRYVLRRVVLALGSLFAVSVLVFLATVALPGGAARAILGPTATPARVAALTRSLHLNRPLFVQYGDWLAGLMTGHFGHSLANGRPVLSYLGPSLKDSFVLATSAIVISVPIAVLVGITAARKARGVWAWGTTLGATFAAALPEFVIGILLIAVLATDVWHILPASSVVVGTGPPYHDVTTMILPVATLGLVVSPYIARNIQEAILAVRQSDYIEYAVVNGHEPRLVWLRYIVPNALGPTLQVIAAEVAWIAGGIVLVEYVFDYPGIGTQLVYAISNRDVPVVQFLTLLIGAVYVFGNLAADLFAVILEPATRAAIR